MRLKVCALLVDRSVTALALGSGKAPYKGRVSSFRGCVHRMNGFPWVSWIFMRPLLLFVWVRRVLSNSRSSEVVLDGLVCPPLTAVCSAFINCRRRLRFLNSSASPPVSIRLLAPAKAQRNTSTDFHWSQWLNTSNFRLRIWEFVNGLFIFSFD